MTTALGPQSANFTTSRPARNPIVSLVDTWFKDCTSAATRDGTVLDQDYQNGILAQLRTAIRSASPPIPLNSTDDTMLAAAIKSSGVRFTASAVVPSTGFEKEGDLWYDTGDNCLCVYINDGACTAFIQIA